ncbi:hypothetical protein [Streptomyces atroolivaceus]|uniref:Uncharacterized protein n=1 Tax=Streptomyces atroolivaceus TaxID=66869 RepID=A0ABV9V9P2_STRAZ|nr:hypothetical protein [Streptomyces atroolivaceus]
MTAVPGRCCGSSRPGEALRNARPQVKVHRHGGRTSWVSDSE